jgi:hypothetical protein
MHDLTAIFPSGFRMLSAEQSRQSQQLAPGGVRWHARQVRLPQHFEKTMEYVLAVLVSTHL